MYVGLKLDFTIFLFFPGVSLRATPSRGLRSQLQGMSHWIYWRILRITTMSRLGNHDGWIDVNALQLGKIGKVEYDGFFHDFFFLEFDGIWLFYNWEKRKI